MCVNVINDLIFAINGINKYVGNKMEDEREMLPRVLNAQKLTIN